MNFRTVLLAVILILLSRGANAQTVDDTLINSGDILEQDTLITSGDILEEDSFKLHSPKRAAIYSAVLPGLGQIYNQKYWKLPIVYAGLGTSVYFITWNGSKYRTYRDAYVARTDTLESTVDAFPLYTADDIKVLREYYHRNLELSVIATGVIYILNIVDATVDAHLFDFDISDDLGMTLQPITIQDRGEYIPGLKFALRF